MQIDIDKINKLPPDVRKRFQKLLIKYKEEDNKLVKNNLQSQIQKKNKARIS